MWLPGRKRDWLSIPPTASLEASPVLARALKLNRQRLAAEHAVEEADALIPVPAQSEIGCTRWRLHRDHTSVHGTVMRSSDSCIVLVTALGLSQRAISGHQGEIVYDSVACVVRRRGRGRHQPRQSGTQGVGEQRQ